MQMISAINAELAKIGYKAVKLPRKRLTVLTVSPNYPPHHPDCVCGCNTKPVDRLTVWNPQTQAGRKCKAAMLRWAKWPKPVGVTSYQVRGEDGQWYSDWMDGFAAAKAYQSQFANRYATHSRYDRLVTQRDLGRTGF